MKLALILLLSSVSLTFSQTSSFPPGAGGSGGGSSGSSSLPSATYAGTSYLPPAGGGTANASESVVQALVTVPGTISNLSVNASVAPGLGNSLTFTWRKNAADQALTCAITGTSTNCSDTAHSFQIAANDLIDIKVVAGGTPAATVLTLLWVTPGPQGPAGSAGAGYTATSSSNLTIGTGSTTFTTQAGLAYSVGARVRASYVTTPTNYMEGLVTSYSGTSMVVNVDTTNGSGTFNSWNINLAGNVGAQGAQGNTGASGTNGTNGTNGAGYSATSTSSVLIGTGAQSFTTQTGLAYSAGARVRASSAANTSNYMEGLVTSYSGTSLAVNVDTVGGSGTHADWNINVAGNVGQTGSQGSAGPAGQNGPQVTAVNAQVGTTYTFLNSDCTKLVTFNNASAVAVTLPQAGAGGNFAATCGIWVNNLGAGIVTVTPTTSTINGAASLSLLTKQSALIISDGTNYSAQVGSGSPSAGTNGTLQCSDGNGGYIACTSGVQYSPATSGTGNPLCGNGSGGTSSCSQSQVMSTICNGTGCGTGTNVVTVAGNAVSAGGQAAADIPVTQSGANATFTCSSNTVNTFRITLTANVTTSTLASCSAGQVLNFVIGSGTGPFTFAYPTGFSLAAGISPIANTTTKQVFEWNGSTAIPLGPATSDSGPSVVIEQAMPAGNPASGFEFCVGDSTQHTYQCKDSSGNISSLVRTAASATTNQWVDYIQSSGIPHTSQPATTQMSDTANVVYTNLARTLSALLTAPGGDLFNGGINAQTGTTYTMGQADENKLTTFNNAGAVAVTLPQATTSGFGAGAYFYMFNRGAGTVTVTPTVSTVNGSASFTLSQNQGCFLVSDGANYSAWISASPAGGNATTVNGGSLPNSAPLISTNSSGQIILATPFAVNTQTATYQVLAADFTSYKTIVVASGTFTITLVASTNQPATGQAIRIINYGTGTVTVARSGQNINGGTSSLTLPASSATAPSSALVVSDGTNYFANVTTPPALANITGLGTNVGTFLGIPSGANLAAALTSGLPQSKYGTGVDTSASTGVLSYSAGTPSVGAVPTGQESTNTVTATSAAAAANQLCVAGGATKSCSYIDFPEHLIIPAANCNNATAGAGWDIPATNAPTVACVAGTNNLGGVLQWANNNTTTNAQFSIQLPNDWNTAVQPYINIYYGSSANTTGTVKWTFATACSKADGSVTSDPAFNAEAATAGKTMAAATRMWSESMQFTAVTSGNNCVAGSNMIIKVTSGNGTATSTVNVSKVTITIPRRLVVQAE